MKKVIFTSATVLLALAVTAPVFAATTPVASTTSNGSITLQQDPGDPEEPEGNKGPLRISRTTPIEFGTQFISGSNATYNALHLADDVDKEDQLDRPNYIQIKDNRGSNVGWTLQVRNTQFAVGDNPTADQILTGAQLTLKPTTVKQSIPDELTGKLPATASEQDEVAISAENITKGWRLNNVALAGEVDAQTIASAQADNGMGFTNIYFGENGTRTDDKDQSKKNDSVQLQIPGTTKKNDKATYTSTIHWMLLAEPSTGK